MRDFLIRGMLAGILAAFVAFAFASIVGEPEINRAIAIEEAVMHSDGMLDQHAHDEPEGISRTLQSTVGLATGLLMLGVAYGGLFAIAFAVASGRIGGLGERGTALLVALAAFTAISLIPFLKYPANPPAVGDPETIVARTQLYFAMILVGVIVTVGAFVLRHQLLARWSPWTASIASALLMGALLVVALLVLPAGDEVTDFPADVLWRFRTASIGMQLSIWLTLGLAFGAMGERAAARSVGAPVRRASAVS